MDTNRLAATVVFYNPTQEEIANINSYIENVSKVYIIDNSSDIKAKELLPNSNKVEYISNGENLGIASALNRAAELAIEEGFEWLLTMDQDTHFEKNTFYQFLEKVDNHDLKEVAIITPWHKTELIDPKPEAPYDYPYDVMTSGNLLNLTIYKELGGFLDWMFIDGVDIDYCFRVRKANYKILRINEVELLHSLGDIKYHQLFGRKVLCTNHNYIRRYYIARNYLYIKDMHSDIDQHTCEINARMRRWIIKILLFEKDKYRKIKSICIGKIDYHRGVKGKKIFNY